MRYLLFVGTALALVPAVASAQEGAPARDDVTIIVTAERRAVDVQDTPVSIVALSGADMRERGVNEMEDLTKEVPSLSFTDNGLSKFVNIRGVGLTESAPYTTVGVAVHLDGTYIARDITYGDAFFDVESIQVLRGPQGTYAGVNANGGAIFIESAKPVIGHLEGYARAEMGNYNRRQLEGGVSVPLSQTLAARFSAKFENRDSFGKTLLPGGIEPLTYEPPQLGNRSNYVGRAQLLWEPSANIQARLIHQYSNLHSDGGTTQNGVPSDYSDPNIFIRNPSRYSSNDLEIVRTTGIIRVDPSDTVRLNANLTYQTTDLYRGGDQDNSGDLIREGFNNIDDDYWTGEVNLLSTGNGPFSWTLGANFVDYYQLGDAYAEQGPEQIANQNGRNFLLETARTNYAVFAELGQFLTDELEVRVGGRYNWDKTGFPSFRIVPTDGLNPDAPSAPFPADNQFVNFEQFTGRVLVNYKPSPDHLFYATVSRGYKPGGLTSNAQEYGSEVVDNFEIGWKGTLIDQVLQGSVSAFYMNYDGYQISIQPDPDDVTSTLTENVDGTTIKGFEAQFSANLGGLSADVGVSYLDSSLGEGITTLPAGANGNVMPLPVDFTGKRTPYAPEWGINGGLAYEIPVGAGYVTPSVRVSYTDDQYVTFFFLPYHRIEARTLVDARLAYSPNEDWTITAYATNLFDEEYTANRSQTTNGVGQFLMGAPRQYGLSVEARF